MTNKNDEVKNFRVELLKKIHEADLSIDERVKFINLIYDVDFEIFEESCEQCFFILKNEN